MLGRLVQNPAAVAQKLAQAKGCLPELNLPAVWGASPNLLQDLFKVNHLPIVGD